MVIIKVSDKPTRSTTESIMSTKTTKTTTAEKTLTVAMFMRALIAAGFTNEEVFAAAVAEYGIGQEKKTYPTWYRAQLRREGVAV